MVTMTDTSAPGLHIADYVVFSSMFLVSLGIGVYFALAGGRQKTTEEYYTGDRKMSVLPVTLSYTVSFLSTILILGYPAEIYSFGAYLVIGMLGFTVAPLLAAIIFVPVLYPLKFISINEYLLERFDSHLVKCMSSFCMICNSVLYASTVYFGPSTAIEAVSGIPAWITILLGCIVSVIYTTIGGIKAVVWTDVFQSVVMLVGMLALVIKGTIHVGGLAAVFSVNKEWGRLDFFDFDLTPYKRMTTWSVVINRMVLFLYVCGTGQASYQRYCSMPTQKKANMVVIGSIPYTFLLQLCAFFMGWIAFAHYQLAGCDPMASGQLSNPNQVIPLFVMEVFNFPGAPGLFLSACAAGSLSSASSALNSGSALALEDFVKPCFPGLTDPAKQATVAKVIVLIFGCVATGLSISMVSVGGTMVQLMGTFSAGFDGVILSLFLLGLFCKFVNKKGAIAGSVVGLTLGLWISFCSYTIKKHL